jgi:hypothetical protein
MAASAVGRLAVVMSAAARDHVGDRGLHLERPFDALAACISRTRVREPSCVCWVVGGAGIQATSGTWTGGPAPPFRPFAAATSTRDAHSGESSARCTETPRNAFACGGASALAVRSRPLLRAVDRYSTVVDLFVVAGQRHEEHGESPGPITSLIGADPSVGVL